MQTYREQFDSAMQCETKEQADAWLEAEVLTYKQDHGVESAEALRTIRINLGYMAGYYDQATADKVLRLFGAAHPIFGAGASREN